MSYMEEIVNHSTAAAGLQEVVESPTPFFALDTGINIMLYTVAVRCRDPIVRRKAIDVLYAANRQEGFWNGRLVAYLANQILEREERGLKVRASSDVPEKARLQDISVGFEDRCMVATLRYIGDAEQVQSIPLRQSNWGILGR